LQDADGEQRIDKYEVLVIREDQNDVKRHRDQIHLGIGGRTEDTRHHDLELVLERQSPQ
jgi:hypothetical protein